MAVTLVSNPITVSGGTVVSGGYTLSLGGNADANSTFAGAITLQNDLTLSVEEPGKIGTE